MRHCLTYCLVIFSPVHDVHCNDYLVETVPDLRPELFQHVKQTICEPNIYLESTNTARVFPSKPQTPITIIMIETARENCPRTDLFKFV